MGLAAWEESLVKVWSVIRPHRPMHGQKRTGGGQAEKKVAHSLGTANGQERPATPPKAPPSADQSIPRSPRSSYLTPSALHHHDPRLLRRRCTLHCRVVFRPLALSCYERAAMCGPAVPASHSGRRAHQPPPVPQVAPVRVGGRYSRNVAFLPHTTYPRCGH